MKLTKKEIKAFQKAKEQLIARAENYEGCAKYWNGICEVVRGVGDKRIKEILYHYKPKSKWKYVVYIWRLDRSGYLNRLKLIDKILKDNI